MTTKITIWVLSCVSVILLALCIWLIFALIDSAISYTYMKASVDEDGKQVERYRRLLEKEMVGISEEDLIEKLKWQVSRSEDNPMVKKEGSYIIFESIRFKIEDKKLKSIL